MLKLKVVTVVTIILSIGIQMKGQDTTTVQINVNMSIAALYGSFNPVTEFVDIAGTMNNWGATIIKCSDTDKDHIYTVTFHGQTVGTVYAYKFRFNGIWDGREEFPGVGNDRKYTVKSGVNIENVWFNGIEPSKPTAKFSSSLSEINKGQSILFKDNTVGYATQWKWTFEGGVPSVSTERNPLVEYDSRGTYKVIFIASNVAGADTVEKTAYVIVSGRTQTVTFNVNMSYVIKTGNFNPTQDSVLIYGSFNNWSKGIKLTDDDNNEIFTASVGGINTEAQIKYLFQINDSTGNTDTSVYVVQTSNNQLSQWYKKILPPYPYADFYVSTTKPIVGEVLQFRANPSGGTPTSYSWTFEGGAPATSTVQNPVVTYNTTGPHAVTLNVKNASGETNITKQALINVSTIDNALGWWNDQVFYQIYPRSFKDNDGDGIGDFKGLMSKLDYLNDGDPRTSTDLGVTALYIMPVHDCTNPQYGGYEVTDYKSITKDYGTLDDFNNLVTEAHARGMKVILDMVFNHSSYQNTWFLEASKGNNSKYEDYYVWNNTDLQWNWKKNNTPHTNPKVNYYWAHFGAAIPDLNYNNPSVKNAIKDISQYWLAKNIDGFRIDAPMYLFENKTTEQNLPETYAYWREWSSAIKKVNPNAFVVGETWLLGDIPSAAKYTYQGFDIGFEMNIAYGIEDALNYEKKSYIQTPTVNSLKTFPFLQFGVLASNHDLFNRVNPNGYIALRIKDRLKNNKDAKAKTAAGLVLTSPGVPFLYYGDEVGASGGYARLPMQWENISNAGFTSGTPWTKIASDYATYNVNSEVEDSTSYINIYKKLIEIRTNEVALKRGSYTPLETNNASVYGFIREYNNDKILVVVNLAAKDLDTVKVWVEKSGIPAKTYGALDLISNQAGANITVEENGKIARWMPYPLLKANSTHIFKLRNELIINSLGKSENNLKMKLAYKNNCLLMSVSGLQPNEEVSLHVYNLQGIDLFQSHLKATAAGTLEYSTVMNNLKSNLYMVKVYSKSGTINRKFIVK